MTYIPYIYVKKNNGFVENVKFMQEIDLTIVKPEDNIKTHYNETYPLYNVAIKNEDNSYMLFKDNELITLTQDTIENSITHLFPKLLNQVVSSNCHNLLNDYEKFDGSTNSPSEFTSYLQQIEWKTKVKFEPQKEYFSLSIYTKIANELIFLAECLENNIQFSHFIKGSVRAFNTFFAYDGIIEDFSHGSFNTSIDDETNKEKIYFGDACRALHYAQERCGFNLPFKKDVKKLKL